MTDFDEFWGAYPFRTTPSGRRVKVGKKAAASQYAELEFQAKYFGGVSMSGILQAATAYAECQDPRFVKDAFRWLRDGGYDDDYEIADSETDRRRDGIAAAVARSMESRTRGAGDEGSGPDGAGAGPEGVIRLDAYRDGQETG